MKRWWVIAVLALVGLAALAGYLSTRPPPGLEVKGGDATVAYLSLATAIVSLATSAVGLAMKLLELREKSRGAE